MDIPSEGGSNSGGVIKVTRELLVSRDGDCFFFVCLCFWYFRRVKSTVLIKYSGNCIIGKGEFLIRYGAYSMPLI